MAAGKNAACAILEKHGFISIDADLCAHKAIETAKSRILEELNPYAEKMGLILTNEDGTINRKALGEVLFSDRKLILKQESIIHPEVDKMLVDFAESNPGKDIIFNATLLYKTPSINLCRAVIFIDAPFLLRMKRAVKRNPEISKKQIFKRFFSQIKIFAKYKKIKSDTYRVRNTSNLEELEKKLLKVLEAIKTQA